MKSLHLSIQQLRALGERMPVVTLDSSAIPYRKAAPTRKHQQDVLVLNLEETQHFLGKLSGKFFERSPVKTRYQEGKKT